MYSPVLTERDLEAIFSGKKKHSTKTPFVKGIVFVASFLAISGLVFVVINFTTLRQNLTFWYNNEYKITPLNPEAEALATIDTTTTKGNLPLPQINNDSLNLPIINVKTPITWQVANNPTDVANGLSKGLIQIKGTALPGEIGNVFITGHSSNYPWAKGNYNNIFALLNKVVIGDMLEIRYQNINYLYKVREIKVVEASDTSVLNSKKESVLTLMTCTPVGTSLRRLIVIANQVYPDPGSNNTMQFQSTNSSLPNVR